jgi:L-alanine-DL-glutamate epimerase-like enolase superfamily enzyme
MRIERIESWKETVPLSRPYTIARKSTDTVDLFFVRLVTGGTFIGLGSASPSEQVTGETAAACEAALDPGRLSDLVGRDPRCLGALCAWLERELSATPAARAALDMALHDLVAREAEIGVVDLLGERTGPLPTSITIGIKPTAEALVDAEEYVGRGFTCLKVKLGHSIDDDVERLTKLREAVGREVRIRVDANEGYSLAEVRRFQPLFYELEIEFLEQPLPASALNEIRELPEPLRRNLALDESLHGLDDALNLLREPIACGTFVVKLMKSGGVSAARRVADVAAAGGRRVMWGCNDESAISIAAALHTAYASPATRYLDLDGSFDLARDPAEGGFVVEGGLLRLVDDTGLGVRIRD